MTLRDNHITKEPSVGFNFASTEKSSVPLCSYAAEAEDVSTLMNKISKFSVDCEANNDAERILAEHEEVMTYF